MAKNKPEVVTFEAAPIEQPGVRGRLQRIEKATTMHAHNFLVRRIGNLLQVRRMALLWLFAAILLVVLGWLQLGIQRPLYSHFGGIEGGSYIEGVVGEIESLNPIFATSVAERGAAKLLFAGLLKTDEKGSIGPDLAESWQATNEGKTYTVTLRPNLQWSDGRPITADDVAFTVNAIQTPNARSPLAAAWRNIRVEVKDPRTVVFTLKAPYAPFLATLTTSILPKHALANIDLAQLRNASFNMTPNVTSGPFLFKGVAADRPGSRSSVDIYMARNDNYFAGAPKLERYSMRVYKDDELLVTAMREREIMAASDIPFSEVGQFARDRSLKVTKQIPYNGVYAFFKTSTPPFDDAKVRQAVAFATDNQAIAAKIGNAQPLHSALIPGQLGYDANMKQPVNNVEEANKLLDQVGWVKNAAGKREKAGQQLAVRLVGLNNSDYGAVAQQLQQQWSRIGIVVNVELMQQDDFQANVITPHAYDVLLYELSLGRDSDAYAFWHSSQAVNGRLNLAEYKSSRADEALDAGRSLLDAPLRAVKYRAFNERWIQDVPAVALYRPTIYYVQLAKSISVKPGEVGDTLERFSSVQYWMSESALLDTTR